MREWFEILDISRNTILKSHLKKEAVKLKTNDNFNER